MLGVPTVSSSRIYIKGILNSKLVEMYKSMYIKCYIHQENLSCNSFINRDLIQADQALETFHKQN